MKKTVISLVVALSLTACAGSSSQQTNTQEAAPAYKNTELDMQTRVKDLVSRMTINEKISQMYNDTPAIPRLDVPAYDYWNEALHGVARAGNATVFPQAIGMAAMWDKDLMLDIATAISDEGRAKHHFFADNDVRYRYTGLTYWSPNINIFRDPRWGRGQETYGEDPFLTGELGVQFIHGLQGDDAKYLKSAATAKHFAVHNGPEISRHSDNYVVSDKDLYETYLPAFEKAVVDGDVEAVMCAYNRVNGMPACGSDMLLKEILRGKYQFDGHVMSDCGAIADFYDPDAHNVVKAPAAAAAWAVTSGTDLNCGTGRLSTFASLNFALEKGLISEELIDQAVERLFMTRFKLGMFDDAAAVPYSDIPMSVVGSEQHLALAQKASEQALVLLKNDGLLPLKKGVKVAVIGPNANNVDVLLGNYNGLPIKAVTPLEGIQQYLGKENVTYAPGSPIIEDIYGHGQVLDEKVLFHKTGDGGLAPGLVGKYYAVERSPVTDFTRLSFEGIINGDPKVTRIDKALDFYFEKSPVDDSVLGDFAVVWQGTLVPETSGQYRFSDDADVSIDGKTIDSAVQLEAGKSYAIKVSKIFADDRISNTSSIMRQQFTLQWVNESENLLQNALDTARSADVLLVMAGISPRIEGEEMPVKLDGFNYGDRTDIDLPEVQKELLKALHSTGKPVVLVNFSGSAMALNWSDKNLNAIVQAFYPGEATGTALARILWGEANPSGRLPVTFYKNIEGFADFDDYAMENRTYRYFGGDVLYPFGYGLSYSDFNYSSLALPKTLTSGDELTVSVDVTNTSGRAGDEVTQLYLRMPDAPVRVPNVALKGFSRTTLQAGETRTVSITIPADELTYIDNSGEKQPYKGRLEVSVGEGQPQYADTQSVQKGVITLQ
ncbi:beta-glucosidase [Alteromonas pelagimontana]|uniref:Beta-glucosidase n=1 Tax=Alteromonas pelagimontana TaxID=1858656 RepID=A0A6M4MEW7_9ALTE|nr:glycoside hydrolase family 3 C-terminal domain-containing protein [Alteromonas pelagimontana]QJR81145.1 beta-glucosidase [Alteromonas pelagimontana]